MLEHGGRLRQAARKYGIPLADWLDLSTGINPNGWPVPALPAECWQRLPEDDDELLPAAHHYYQNESLLAVAGSQAAIQVLPLLRPKSRVGILNPAYAEHAAAWQKAGHQMMTVDADKIEVELAVLDVLILINPNNPTGKLWSRQQLLDWHQTLNGKGGWLIVDEAFIDGMPEHSLSSLPVQKGLIILRSVGKFFGLAGIRCGFVISEHKLLDAMAERLGPWAISHTSRYIAAMALADSKWQRATAFSLNRQGQRLQKLLTESGWQPNGGCALFQWIEHTNAVNVYHALARHGILTRLFNDSSSLRFGLPGDESAWWRLTQALSQPNMVAL
ncbi:threonine-phosphate decarboxylase CobD [Methylobacter luteus]|uniref:threonine-phosphate decarboxylase CobD n=1 Tax=Methylobacter luteus TaxID=415 RepID=UPI000429728F|nr:threonine-phosphate decarboxylase CobD [Methylobacter luteus]